MQPEEFRFSFGRSQGIHADQHYHGGLPLRSDHDDEYERPGGLSDPQCGTGSIH